MKRIITALLVATTFALGGLSLTACSPTEGSAPVAAVDFTADTVVIDVRTPEEFTTGHLTGSVNIDWEGAEFMQAIDSLDKSAHYVVYCRSGNRAGKALDMMMSMGFLNVQNLGSVDEAAATTGLAVVTD